MIPGDIVLIEMPQRDGRKKRRPALVLTLVPPFDDCLVCGISSQIHQEVVGFDYVLRQSDRGFAATGLKSYSLIRLGFVTTVSKNKIPGIIGHISVAVHQELLERFTFFLKESA